MDIAKAIKPQKVDGQWLGAQISGRYKSVVKKEYIKAGVPWVYEPEKNEEINPRHKQPKRPKFMRNKSVRLSELKSLVQRNDQIVNDYRQEFLNNRRYRGTARFVKEFAPSWMSYLRSVGSKVSTNSSTMDVFANPEAGFGGDDKKKQSKVAPKKKDDGGKKKDDAGKKK